MLSHPGLFRMNRFLMQGFFCVNWQEVIVCGEMRTLNPLERNE